MASCRRYQLSVGASADDGDTERVCALLSAADRYAVARYVTEPLRRTAAYSRLLQSRLVRRHSHLPDNATLIVRHANVKPVVHRCSPCPRCALLTCEPIRYSISHDCGYVVAAVVEADEAHCGVSHPLPLIGIDITSARLPTRVRDVTEYVAAFVSVFTDDELRRIVSADDDDERAYRFALSWAAKESVLKAIGVGLAADVRSISITLSSSSSSCAYHLGVSLSSGAVCLATALCLHCAMRSYDWRLFYYDIEDFGISSKRTRDAVVVTAVATATADSRLTVSPLQIVTATDVRDDHL